MGFGPPQIRINSLDHATGQGSWAVSSHNQIPLFPFIFPSFSAVAPDDRPSDWSREPPDRAYCKGAGSRYRHHFVVYGGQTVFWPESPAHMHVFHPPRGGVDGRTSRRDKLDD